MTEFKEFNEVYTSQQAKDLREEMADLNFNIEYLSIRINKLNEQLQAKHNEYLAILGVKKDGETAQK